MSAELSVSTETLLKQGLQDLQLTLTDNQVQLLLLYLEEFYKWNKAYNLSAIRDLDTMVSRHLLDSLALVPYLQAFLERQGTPVDIVDVGTGGGLPGLPLAIAFPEIRVTLLDSNGKKTRFLFHTATKLELKNVQVENNRVENFSPINKFAIVTSRAFASLQAMIAGTAHLLADGGEYWAMKGQYPHAELADCEYLASLQAVHPLTVPGCDGDRHLVILTTNR